jgi:hypothetical protein
LTRTPTRRCRSDRAAAQQRARHEHGPEGSLLEAKNRLSFLDVIAPVLALRDRDARLPLVLMDSFSTR